MLVWIEECDRFCRIHEVAYDFEGFEELKGFLISTGAGQVRILADQQDRETPLVLHEGPVEDFTPADLPSKPAPGYRISALTLDLEDKMDTGPQTDITARIKYLERYVSEGLYPFSDMESFIEFEKSSYHIGDDDTVRDEAWYDENGPRLWLEYLEGLKREKDSNTRIWQKLCNWD